MGDAGYYRFPAGNLDPAAQEFHPAAHRPVPVYFPYPPHQHHFAEFAHAPPPPPHSPPQTVVVSPPPPPRSMPSRALLLSMVPADVSESILRRELEVFGDVRAVQMERLLREGIVTVHFYDLRQAQAALEKIQYQHMQQQYRLRRHHDAINFVAVNYAAVYVPPLPAPPHPAALGLIAGRAVWAQFTAPAVFAIPDGTNQGSLVVFNLEPRVSPETLHRIFEEFGNVREVRDSPKRKYQKFVEFYDVREAARALIGLNDREIRGRKIGIEFSRQGGYRRKYYSNPKPDQPHRSYGIIPAGLPSPIKHLHSGRYTANPDYFNKKEYHNSGGSTSRFSRSSSNSSGASMNLSGGLRSKKKMGNCSPATTATTNDGSTTSSSGGSSSKQRPHRQRSKVSSSSSRQSKVDNFENPDHRFLINEGLAIDETSMDSRTTVMIKNIPNKYSQNLLLNMLDNHCIHCNELIGDDESQPLSSYDFVYLPIDFSNKCNVGYGFVNMTSPEATLRLYKAFHRQSWEVFNSRKICEINYARLQGLEALKEHFRNSKFPSEVEEFMPVVFTPPRDGRRLTDPAVVSSRTAAGLRRVKCSSSSSSAEGDNVIKGAVINGSDCDGNSNDDDEGEDVVYCSRGLYSGGACGSGNGGAGGGDWRE